MEIHPYHDYFLPILIKLLEAGQTSERIDVTECFTGTPEQNNAVFNALNESKFATVKKGARVLTRDEEYKPQTFFAMILPLGIEYINFCQMEYERLTKERKPVGFQLPNKDIDKEKPD